MAYLKIGNWSLHTNGLRGTLCIHEIDELGRVFGTVCDAPIRGWWSERAHRLTFVRERAQADGSDDQGFEGYAWDEPAAGGSPRLYHLAGSYETFGGGGGAKDRQTFGWFATLVCNPNSPPQLGRERTKIHECLPTGGAEAERHVASYARKSELA